MTGTAADTAGPAAAARLAGAVLVLGATLIVGETADARTGSVATISPDYAPPGPVQGQRARAIPYNGKFTFTRLMYGGRYGRRGGSSWSHDYPNADLNIPEILEFMTSISVTTGASNVFTLDDPRLFQFPLLYISEPGFWTITDSEARNLRDYVLKGGFLIFDDFERDQLYNMVAQVERALPGFELIEIGPDHEIFDSFFLVENIYIPHPLVPVTPGVCHVVERDQGTDPATEAPCGRATPCSRSSSRAWQAAALVRTTVDRRAASSESTAPVWSL